MPYAQNHYPFSKTAFYPFPDAQIKSDNIDIPADYPADFICEAIDQTRGWFYTLEVLSALLFNHVPFRNVIVTDHGLDAKGKKQSKSLGNVIDPNEALNTQGADSLRWFIYAKDSTKPLRMSLDLLKDSAKELLIPYFSAFNFFKTYSEIDGFVPEENVGATFKPELELDRWILYKLSRLVKSVDDNLENLKISRACDDILNFIDDLNNWYIRLNRKRFWKSENDQEKIDGYKTLWIVLFSLSKVLAPFVPFSSERIFQEIRRETDPESVHLANWPRVVFDVPQELISKVDSEKMICSIVHSARAKSKIKLRQPLGKLLVYSAGRTADPEVIAAETNFKKIEFIEKVEDVPMDIKVKPRAEKLVQKYKSGFEKIQQLINTNNYFIDVKNRRVLLGEGMATETTLFLAERKAAYHLDFNDLFFDLSIEEPCFVAGDFSTAICIVDATIDEPLKMEGFAREFIRKVQELRKEKGLSVTDRIDIRVNSQDEFAVKSLQEFEDTIKTECLGVSIKPTNEPIGEYDTDGFIIGIEVQKA
jgi:isoleucyl-tRNA synthetase